MNASVPVTVLTARPIGRGAAWHRLERLLSPDEAARLHRYRVEPARRLFLSAHALLRLALSEVTGVPPPDLRFEADPLGKPRVAGPGSAGGVHFSLTHTDGLVACALAPGPEVGVDAESLDREGRFDDLAARFYAPDERRLLAAVPAERHREAFLDIWTLKEAYLKARGLGLSVPTSSVSFTPDDAESAAVAFFPPLEDTPSSWRFARLRLGGHRVAVAVRATGLAVTLRDATGLLLG